MKLFYMLIILLIILNPAYATAKLSDEDIQKILIQKSLAQYSGNCPCPYNTDRAGRSCGRRSAYSKPGGYEPLCYPSDITLEMIEAYRHEHPSAD